MVAPSVHTTHLHHWLERIRAGDLAARDELLRSLCGQLEHLARKMLRRYPSVRRWAQTDDVLQNALLRLLRALEQIQPESMREFFGLATEQIRRELLDLARRFNGPQGHGANLVGHFPGDGELSLGNEPRDQGDDPLDLERWCRFHQEVEKLSAEEREVVGLIFYHGRTQAEVAQLVGVTVRTIQRRWQAALLNLHRVLQRD
jgi:RNA polymerase sigma factor (sigma-70 family)